MRRSYTSKEASMTRDKIQQLARDAGGIRAVGYADPECFMGNMSFTDQELAAFTALVLEEAARVCDEAYSRSAGAAERTKSSREITIYQTAASRSEYLAQAIRAMKP